MSAPTCGAVLDAWFAEWGPQLKPATRKRIPHCIDRQLVWLRDKPVTALSTPVLWEYVEHWTAEGLSPGTINQSLAWLRRSMRLLWEGELSEFDWEPPDGREGKSPGPRITAAMKRCETMYGHTVDERQPLTPAEAEILLACADELGPELAPMLRLAIGTGMRGGELRALHWDCVDLRRSVIEVRRNFSADVIGTPKGRRRRTVHLPQGCVDMLRSMREKALRISRTGSTFVFERNQLFWTESQLGHAMNRVLSAAVQRGVREGLSLHSARHFYVTHALDQGVPMAWLQHQVGQTAKTLERYTHPSHFRRPNLSWADFE